MIFLNFSEYFNIFNRSLCRVANLFKFNWSQRAQLILANSFNIYLYFCWLVRVVLSIWPNLIDLSKFKSFQGIFLYSLPLLNGLFCLFGLCTEGPVCKPKFGTQSEIPSASSLVACTRCAARRPMFTHGTQHWRRTIGGSKHRYRYLLYMLKAHDIR